MTDAHAEVGAPSPFFVAWRDELRRRVGEGRVLDVACGRGRHARAAAALGLDVLAIDRDAEALEALAGADPGPGRIETLAVDLETGTPPPRPADRFGAVLVFRYLHRPLVGWLADRLAPGGLLLYETFTTDQRSLGWGPSRDDFLLAPGELPTLFPDLEPLAFEEGPTDEPRPARTARLAAIRPA